MQIKNNIVQFDRNKSMSSGAEASDQTNSFQTHVGNSGSMIPNGPLKDIANYTSQWVSDAIATLFDNVDTQLFEMAEKSERSTEQNTYFDAMRIIRLRRNQANEAFYNNVNQAFLPDSILSKKKLDEAVTDIDNLTLINDDNLEEDLATLGMVAKAERDNRELLTHLNQRLAYLYQGINIHNENNPLGPTSLCSAFSNAVDTLDADIKVKLLVFKLFDINVITKLTELYQQVNKRLIEREILPDLKISYRQSSGKTAQRQPQDVATGLPINKPVNYPEQADNLDSATNTAYNQQAAEPAIFDHGEEAYQLLQHLVAQNKRSTPAYVSAQTTGTLASTSDIVDSLQQLQVASADYHTQNALASSALLKEALKQALQANNHNQAINQQDDDLIDIIGMLFDFILNDENLVDTVKALIGRLQIPLIKIALQDKTFFSNKSHPARKFLNDLANIGLGVTDELPAKDNPLYLKLDHLVNRILNEMNDASDSSLFTELLEDLERFTLQFNQGKKKSKTSSHAAAMQLVKTELDSRLNDKQVPHTITLLLERVWKDVMVDIFFNEGMESDEWDMAITFIDTLIWSIDPKVDIQSQKQLVRVIPGILNALNAGLNRIHYPKDLREQLLQDLQSCHLSCMKGKSIDESQLSYDDSIYISKRQNNQQQSTAQTAEDMAAEPVQPLIDANIDHFGFDHDLSDINSLDEEELLASLEDGSEEAISDHGEDELIDDSYTQQAQSLSPGSWVDFYGPDEVTYRAKISWMSEDASAFIFVTQTGQIAEKSLAGLSAALRNGQAKILDKSPIFERAMDAVLEDLQ